MIGPSEYESGRTLALALDLLGTVGIENDFVEEGNEEVGYIEPIPGKRS